MRAAHQFDRLLLYVSLNWQQFISFLVVGVINTLFGYGIFTLLIYLGVHYILASTISTCIAILFSFTTMGKIVFKQYHKSLFLRYVSVYALCTVISILFISVGTHFSPNIYLLGALSLFPTVFFSFLANKYYVFKWIPYETH